MNSKFEKFENLDSQQIYTELNNAIDKKDYELTSYLLKKNTVLNDIATNYKDVFSSEPKTEIGILLKKLNANKKEDLLKVLEKEKNTLWIDDNPAHFSEYFKNSSSTPLFLFSETASDSQNKIKDVLKNLRETSDKSKNPNNGKAPK
jgi:nitrate reductase assembly molybdenum cofactor insertion protein NarJ